MTGRSFYAAPWPRPPCAAFCRGARGGRGFLLVFSFALAVFSLSFPGLSEERG